MATTSASKRPAYFEDDRDQQKRARKSDKPPREDRDRRRDRSPDRNKDRDHDQQRPRSRDRDRKNRHKENAPKDEGRGDRNGDRERKGDVRKPSPARDGRRDRTRDRPGQESSKRDNARTRSPARTSTTVDTKAATSKSKKEAVTEKPVMMDVDTPAEVDDDGVDPEVMRVMGFRAFKSTHNKKVPGNDKLYGVRKEKKTEYRQYMNRPGGFNRPLSPSRS